MLRPERLRQVPKQFSWVDQGLVQRRLIDRCDARAAALYLFLVTVSDAQGMSYYGASTLTQRLHLEAAELDLARRRLIELELIAYQAPLTQVLALPGAPGKASPKGATEAASTVSAAGCRQGVVEAGRVERSERAPLVDCGQLRIVGNGNPAVAAATLLLTLRCSCLRARPLSRPWSRGRSRLGSRP